ncbi:MAG: cardiolipin synthase [Planctomycetota bacterium]
MPEPDSGLVVGSLLATFWVLGLASAVDAILKARTSQGAVAWALSLLALPVVAVPLYWIFGRNKYHGYVKARRRGESAIQRLAASLEPLVPGFRAELGDDEDRFHALEELVRMPFTAGNRSRLLIDGEEIFTALFEAIASARRYVLVQSYIVREDRVGRRLLELMAERARAGVHVFFLYDEIGSRDLSRGAVAKLEEAGVEVSAFRTTKGRWNRFQINFRNHRKAVVVDGREAFVGGSNFGVEYLGEDPAIGPWRDTQVGVRGPAVQCVQLSFLEDWFWATGRTPAWDWEPTPVEDGDEQVLVLPTGPADRFETASCMFVETLRAARHRAWIATPYLVPDHAVLAALQLAALRGVDVRVLIPAKADHMLTWLASFSTIDPLLQAGAKLYSYEAGFLHQKALVVDDDIALVGTANLDNRSFRLNFELCLLWRDRGFAERVARMLAADLERCRPILPGELAGRGPLFRFSVAFARLWAPIL